MPHKIILTRFDNGDYSNIYSAKTIYKTMLWLTKITHNYLLLFSLPHAHPTE